MTNYVFIYQNEALLIENLENTFQVPHMDQSPFQEIKDEATYLFYEDDQAHYYLMAVKEDYLIPDGYCFKSLRDTKLHYGEHLYTMALQSYQLYNWRRQHQYCGKCGSPFAAMKKDRSMTCTHCHNVLFPQTSTAVITAIIKDGKILLAHNTNFPESLYSLIAGFVEMGESFEDAVHREIFEEVGLKVKNVRYFDNQPWPFPNSTMIGYFADYDSGDIHVDGEEIIDADWYLPEDFPDLPSGYSIARRLIEAYREGNY